MFTEETAPEAGPLLTQVSSTRLPEPQLGCPRPTALTAHRPVEQKPGPKTSLVPGTKDPAPPPATGSQVAAANGNSGSPRGRAALGFPGA